MTMSTAEATSRAAWYEAYPAPRTTSPASISRDELLSWFQQGKAPGVDFLLVDLRRVDHEGGTIKGSLNLPAQSLYASLPTLVNLVQAAKIPIVVWYCGSSRGRGTRAASWLADILSSAGITTTQSVILQGGIKEWVGAGEAYTHFMDEYDAAFWETAT